MSLDSIWKSQTPQFVNRAIKLDPLNDFTGLLVSLRKHEEVRSELSFWDEFLHDLSWINWYWTNSVTPLNIIEADLKLRIDAIKLFIKDLDDIRANKFKNLNEIINKIEVITKIQDAPLIDEIIEHLDPQSNVCFLANNLNALSSINSKITKSKKWHSMQPTKLRKDHIFDEMIIFGQINNFIGTKFIDNSLEFLLTSPRANKIYWSHYEWVYSNWKPVNYLEGSSPKTRPLSYNSEIFNSIKNKNMSAFSEASIKPSINEEKLLERIKANIEKEDLNDQETSEEAHCFILSQKQNGNNLAAYVLKGDKAKVIDDFNGDGTLDIEDVNPEQVGVGMYILKRMEGVDRDIIEDIADDSLGEKSIELRLLQQKWRRALTKKINDSSEEFVIKELKKEGISFIDKGTLKRWTTETIKPRSDQHFFILLKFLSLEKEFNKISEAMKLIQKAHVEAGQKIGKLLKKEINKMSTKNFSGEVQVDFNLLGEEFGTISAFKVETKITELLNIPRNWGGWGVKEIKNG